MHPALTHSSPQAGLTTAVVTPAVAVPVSAPTVAMAAAAAATARAGGADVVEWRVDGLGERETAALLAGEGARAAAAQLRAELGGAALLATYRSLAEGGPGPLGDEDYLALGVALVDAGVDGVDVELSRPAEDAAQLVTRAHERGVAVVGSSHDFSATPDDLDARFAELARRGSDVLKVAVMPHSDRDVLRLLTAAVQAREAWSLPVLPIAMGPLGVVTRVAGSLWGAPFTFARVGEGSAPGQLTVGRLRQALEILASATPDSGAGE